MINKKKEVWSNLVRRGGGGVLLWMCKYIWSQILKRHKRFIREEKHESNK